MSYAQLAYDSIKQDIISQKLIPGSFVSEAEYAEQLNISRTPVREALKTLEREGLLDIYPRKGVQIKSFSFEDIVYIHEAAEALEGVVMANIAAQTTAGRIDVSKINALQELIAQMDLVIDVEDMYKWLSLDQEFHKQIINLCSNPYLAQYAATSRDRMNLTLWFVTPKYADKRQSKKEHQDILNAIKAGNQDEARLAAQQHICKVRKKLMNAFGI